MPVTRPTQHGDAVLPGTGYPLLALTQLPHPDLLHGVFFFGEGADIAVTDWSGSSHDVDFVGSPQFPGAFARVSGAGYGVTGAEETLAATIFAIFRETSAGGVGIYGNFGGGAAVGLSMYVQSGSSTVSVNTGREGNTGGAASVGSNTAEWGMISAQVPVSGQMRLKNHLTGSSSTGGSSLARLMNGTGMMRIGQFEAGGFNGESDVFMIVHYAAALTNAQTDEVAAALRLIAADYGIAV